MKTKINSYFSLDEKAHHYFHHCKTTKGYFDLPKVIYYTVLASLYNAYIDAVIDDVANHHHKGKIFPRSKFVAIQKQRKKELILFCASVNEVYCINIKIPKSRRFDIVVNKYDRYGYGALINGRIGNQNGKRKHPNPRIENLKQLYLQGYSYNELSELTGYKKSAINSYIRFNKWAELAKRNKGNRRNKPTNPQNE